MMTPASSCQRARAYRPSRKGTYPNSNCLSICIIDLQKSTNKGRRELETCELTMGKCLGPLLFTVATCPSCKFHVYHDMLKHMRTTINLPDDLILQAKKAALEADTTLTEIIANALREALAKRHRKPGRTKTDLSAYTYGSGGVQPGVDLDDTSALLDLMDGIDDPHRR